MELVIEGKPVARIVCLGEAMIELSRDGEGWRMGYGGDTLNIAVHLARAGHDVAYVTALGNDTFSLNLRRQWEAEGVDCALIMTHPDRQAGLYTIDTDAEGERSFAYWRSASAARALFEVDGVGATLASAAEADLLCFSLISLAILPDEGRQQLIDLARRVRAQGGKVAFDGNYRPRLWESTQAALRWYDAAIAVADIGLPTFEDEASLRAAGDPAQVMAHWQSLGCSETLAKLGEAGCLLPDGTQVAPQARLRPVDTSGAGDAFDAGYLAARMRGGSVLKSAAAGHRLAGWAIMRGGAVPARDAEAPYEAAPATND